MARAKVIVVTTIRHILLIDVDNLSRYSRILATTGNHKKAFQLSVVVFILNKDKSQNYTILNK